MGSEFERCIGDRKLVPFRPTSGMIKKEINAATYDLKRAQNSLDEDDPKWATIQGYYVIFHAARALIYKNGYREKSHRCLLIALQELYVDKGLISGEFIDSFREAMDLREDADYGFIFDLQSARNIIEAAIEFLAIAKRFATKSTK
jgi:uncharacterized protein (UPF0332 family)